MLMWPVTTAAPGSGVCPPREMCLFPMWLNTQLHPSTLGCPPRSLHKAGPSGFPMQASMGDGETQDILRQPQHPCNFHEPVLSVSLQGWAVFSFLRVSEPRSDR